MFYEMKVHTMTDIKILGFKTSEWVGILLVLALAFILRQLIHIRLFPDSIEYLTFARNVLSGIHSTGDVSLIKYKWSPLYPHLVALLSFGNPGSLHLAEVARQVSIFAGSLLAVPLYFLARKLVGTGAALVAALLCAITPEFLYYSGAVLTESLSTFLVICGLLALWSIQTKTRPLYFHIFPGLLLGYTFLARHALIGYFGLALAWILIHGFVKRQHLFKVIAPRLALLIAGFVIAISPQVLYLKSQTGNWTMVVDVSAKPTESAKSAGTDLRYTLTGESIHSLTPDATRFHWEVPSPDGGMLSTIIKDPGGFLGAYFKTVFGGYLPDTYPLPYPPLILILSAIGVIGLITSRNFPTLAFVFWNFAGYYLFLSLFHNMRDRYMFPAFPMLLILAGAGAVWIASLAGNLIGRNSEDIKSKVHNLALAIIIVITIGAVMPRSVKLIKIQNTKADMSFFVNIGKDIGSRIEPGSTIFDRTPHIPFFAGGNRTTMPYAPVEDVLTFARARGVKYWVVSSMYVPRLRPQFASLLNPNNRVEGLVPVAVYGNSPANRIIVYRIF